MALNMICKKGESKGRMRKIAVVDGKDKEKGKIGRRNTEKQEARATKREGRMNQEQERERRYNAK